MKRIISLATLLVLLIGCASDVVLDEEPIFPWLRARGVTKCDNGIIFQRLITNVQAVALKYEKERRLKLLDSHIYYDERLSKIRLDFSSMALLQFYEARYLLVDLVDDLIASFEADNVLMGELGEDRINPNVMEVYIDFKPYIAKFVLFDYVGWVTLVDGMASYWAFDMRTERLDYLHYRVESYPESRAIARAMREAQTNWDKAHEPEPGILEKERFRYKT